METSPHILVIDDNRDLLQMLTAMLRLKAYKVSTKDNADNMETTLSELAPDVIFMDMLLSGADGCEICRRLKANPAFSNIPIIMISAHPQAKDECLKAGANYFLDKPFEMQELFKVVESALQIN
ncbi:MAG: response regulator [Ginsengibacter sp.]